MDSRSNALKNDLLIEDLVVYELTRGTTRKIEKEDLEKLQHRFAEYKRLIRTGEFTYDQLANKIYSKYGIVGPLIQEPIPVLPVLPPDPPRDQAMDYKEAMNAIKEIVKPRKWYQRIWDSICVTLSRFYISI